MVREASAASEASAAGAAGEVQAVYSKLSEKLRIGDEADCLHRGGGGVDGLAGGGEGFPGGLAVVHNAEGRETVRECAACLDVLDVEVAGVIRGVRRVGRKGRRRDAVEVGDAAVGGDEHDVLELGGVGPGVNCGGGVGEVGAVSVAGRVESVEQFVDIRTWRGGHGCVRVGVYTLACANVCL